MLLQDSRIGRDFSRDSTARSQYFERIRDTDAQLVFIVDEVDVLDDYEARASSQNLDRRDAGTSIPRCGTGSSRRRG